MRHMGSYYDLPGAAPEEYATAGIGYIPYPQHVDPGIDVSHYGAPYKQMLGLDGLGEMLYRYQGLGWTPGPGQRWADDPRMVKKFAEITATYRPSNIASGDASKAADMILARARSVFSGMTVRKIGTTGWTRDGRVGFTVILRRETRAGEVREKVFQIGQNVGPRIGANTRLTDARVSIPERFYASAPAPPAPTTSDVPDVPLVESEPSEPFLTRTVAGLPVWAVGLIGLGIVGGAGYMMTRPKKVAANRRRRRRRRRR